MKPVSLCLVQMGKKGLELVEAYPNVLPKEYIDEITYKCMPLGGKAGDFLSAAVGDVFFSSYIFSIPQGDNERDNIASIVAIYSNMDYNIAGTQKVFEVVLKKIKETTLLKMDFLQEVLPSIYKGFVKGKFTVNIKSMSTISIDFDSKEEDESKNESDSFADDMWR